MAFTSAEHMRVHSLLHDTIRLRADVAEGPKSRELSLAVTKLQEAEHWLHAALRESHADELDKGGTMT